LWKTLQTKSTDNHHPDNASPAATRTAAVRCRRFKHSNTCCFPKGILLHFLLATKRWQEMKTRADIQQGTLALMVLKTLDVLGPLHGYGIARRIEQISGDQLALNQGTLYPLLLRLEQEGAIASDWGPSENNRRARFYRLTRAGRKQLQAELRDWQQTAEIIARFLSIDPETQS
jgi:PadR family transcriptional regulator PadR